MNRHRSYKNNKSILIGGLLAVVVIMAVGYAAFASSLKISGTSNISTSWNISITDITTSNKVGSASVSGTPEHSGLTASFNTNLVLPGDSITYNIKVENKGNLNVKLNKITLKKDNNPAILFETSGIKEGDVLKQGTSSTLSVKVTYSNSVTSQPNNLDASLTVTLDFVQSDGSSGGTGGDTSNAAAEMLKAKVVTNGDGLYTDSTEAGRYIYRGANPDNYIKLGDDMYRIIAVESDNTIKVIYNGSIGNMSFDTAKSCDEVAYVTPKNKTKISTDGNSTTYEINGGIYTAAVPDKVNGGCNRWSRRADLNVYLNDTWYNTLKYSNLITSHTWNVGAVSEEETNLQTSVNEEKKETWDGKIGLMNVTDYVKASTNSACTSVNAYNSNSSCYKNSATHNWIYAGPAAKRSSWTITPYSYNSPHAATVFSVGSDGYFYYTSASTSLGAAPVLYLSSDISLEGEGTSNSPYTVG
mgnify:CR=1 FL=1